MLRNYLKIALRNLLKSKGYSAINIGGLAIGMAVAMLAGLWIYDELSFNKNHKNYDHIGMIVVDQVFGGELQTSKSVPYPFVQELKTNYSDNFKYIVPSTHTSDGILTVGEKKLNRKGQFIAAEGPEMLSLEMRRGSWASLQDQQSIMLSSSAAKALFGKVDPMNKVVSVNSDMLLKVAGIYADFPKNSQFYDVHFLGSWDYFIANNRYMREKQWDNHALNLYVEVKPGVEFAKASAAIKDSELNVIRHLDNMKNEAATNPQMWVHPMSDWHLYSNFKNGQVDSGPVQYVWLVGVIGFFVLLLACINFMNLSTARSEKRAKEVGIRKAIGSLRLQLIGQFFSESFLVVLLSFAIAMILLNLSLPWFNDLSAKEMIVHTTNSYFWLVSIAFILITGFLAGSYPALYLTSFQPVKVLKGSIMHVGRFASLPRKVLVVMQFTVSIALVICTIIIYSQVNFAKNRPVGYSRDGLLMIEMKSDDFYKKSELISAELKRTGVVGEVALSQSPVTDVWSQNGGFSWKGMTMENPPGFSTLTVSPEYANVVQWKFVAGRNFSGNLASDSAGFVINETAAKLLGFKQPVGETLSWQSHWMTNDVKKDFRILGVVKDMVMESPFQKVAPSVFFLFGEPNWINIRLNDGVNASAALPKIEAVFRKLTPTVPFEYKFADQEYDAKFRSEERMGKLAGFFASLAIFISCLGLFGLASFVAEQRTKEIGIRKVLGASVRNLWQMLSQDFIQLVVIAAIIATPIAWYAMQEWLVKYAYRTEISGWIFAGTGLGALIVTLLTVSYQAIRAAMLDPVKTLKSE
ncbi:ABC transporter permease [Dyadobacter chenwenxiniae]|uniref:ABC transporter permease n=1 Tax=Dyadobacter chenwenxiniae TaxID=2906456 RepID=A0A9X1PJ00_9BACT|nr:ABC transporter permease [Dyadobacter chenwenxiniae]MCF0061024.1 ABC transporter permease [Dyadobacter chenwenxiniae]UON80852.1 ABC transporter permease [Dyadobacter chenwenxiniae]